MIRVMIKTDKVTQVPNFTLTCFVNVTNKVLAIANTVIVTTGNTVGLAVGNTISAVIK